MALMLYFNSNPPLPLLRPEKTHYSSQLLLPAIYSVTLEQLVVNKETEYRAIIKLFEHNVSL